MSEFKHRWLLIDWGSEWNNGIGPRIPYAKSTEYKMRFLCMLTFPRAIIVFNIFCGIFVPRIRRTWYLLLWVQVCMQEIVARTVYSCCRDIPSIEFIALDFNMKTGPGILRLQLCRKRCERCPFVGIVRIFPPKTSGGALCENHMYCYWHVGPDPVSGICCCNN